MYDFAFLTKPCSAYLTAVNRLASSQKTAQGKTPCAVSLEGFVAYRTIRIGLLIETKGNGAFAVFDQAWPIPTRIFHKFSQTLLAP
jgi:hypothetical protein